MDKLHKNPIMQLKSPTEPQAMASAAPQSIHPFGWKHGDGKVIPSWVKTAQISFCNMILWVLIFGGDLVSKRLHQRNFSWYVSLVQVWGKKGASRWRGSGTAFWTLNFLHDHSAPE